ncbi:MAG TPA: hypothetical protein VNZ22_22650, partial [Bacillota bacterium]|nr:hypothetical protein [Bacillota bacterium]
MNDGENQDIQQYSYSRSEAKAEFTRKLNHYWDLLLRRWWVLAIGAILGVAIAATLAQFQKASYTSVGRMMVSNKLSIPEGAVYTEDSSSFLGTQTALMQSDVVSNRAYMRVVAQNTALVAQDTNLVHPSFGLKVTVSPKTSIFVLQGSGPHPELTRSYVQACMEEYIALRKEMRAQTS